MASLFKLINFYFEQWKNDKKLYVFVFVRKKKQLIYTEIIYIKAQITTYERIDCYFGFVASFNS